MVKKFTIPFASQGDANDIPDALQVDGKVSFTQGFGYDYERPYDDPQAKDIAREDMNGLFKAITSAVGELQTLGASEWSNAISYPKGAIVYFEKDLYISQVDDNQNKPPQNWVSITSIANDSLKKVANLSDLTNKTTARNNLGLGSSATLNKTDVLGASTNLVATQKLVNDTKINLENSKQDKLTFTGTGNVARMSEVDKKRDLTDSRFNVEPQSVGTIDLALPTDSVSLYLSGIDFGRGIHHTRAGGETKFWIDFPNKSGVFALTSDILGYGQKWVDVTSQRVAGTTYTNNTGKPIQLTITTSATGPSLNFSVGGVLVAETGTATATATLSLTAIIPAGMTYVAIGTVKRWTELR